MEGTITEYCTSCGRCKNCGAKQGASPTLIFLAVNNAGAAPQVFTVETINAAGAAPAMAWCEHYEIRQ